VSLHIAYGFAHFSVALKKHAHSIRSDNHVRVKYERSGGCTPLNNNASCWE